MILFVPKTLDFFDKVVQRKYSKKKKSRANLKKVVRPLFQLIGYFIRLQLEVKLFYIKCVVLVLVVSCICLPGCRVWCLMFMQ